MSNDRGRYSTGFNKLFSSISQDMHMNNGIVLGNEIDITICDVYWVSLSKEDVSICGEPMTPGLTLTTRAAIGASLISDYGPYDMMDWDVYSDNQEQSIPVERLGLTLVLIFRLRSKTHCARSTLSPTSWLSVASQWLNKWIGIVRCYCGYILL